MAGNYAIPDVYDEVDLITLDRFLPDTLAKPRIAGIRLFEWLALVLIRVINRRAFGWSIEAVIPMDVLLQAVGLAVAAALAAGIYPAWRMSRTPPAPALREE